MNRHNLQKTTDNELYQKRNGDVVIEFVKPMRLTKRMFHKERSVVFQVPV